MKKKINLLIIVMILMISLLTFTACTNNSGENTNTGNGGNTDNNIDNIVPQNTGKLLYTLKEDDTYEVSGYTDTLYDLIIPETYNGKPVTSIKGNLFFNSNTQKGCETLKNLTIANNITDIGDGAFYGCSSLESIIVEQGNTKYHSKNNCLIETLEKKLILGCKNSSIPEYVISIGYCAYYNCSNLTNITIPSSVESIGSSAFSGCTNLVNLQIDENNQNYKSDGNCILSKDGSTLIQGFENSIIPDYITRIKMFAFSGCSSLKSIVIPSSVTSIGSGAFAGCSSLESIIVEQGNTKYHSKNNCLIETLENKLILGCKNSSIPNSVTSIEGGAFRLCSSLTSITIPSSVESIGNSAFSGCTNLVNLQIDENNQNYKSDGNCILSKDGRTLIQGFENSIIPSYVTSIGNEAFFGCSSLTSINIPNSVTSIGDGAFSSCISLTSINIPNSVTSIGNEAFSRCSSLTSINIPNSVTSIGSSAFSRCSSLTSINIPNSVTSIGNGAFSSCSSLTSIIVEQGNAQFHSKDNCLIETATKKLVSGCKDSVIPIYVTSIGDNAYLGCSRLTSIIIPNNVTSIGSFAFSGCSSLTNIAIPSSVTSIGRCAFEGCSSLTSIIVEQGNVQFHSKDNCLIETATNKLILGCKDSVIPSYVKNIGEAAFFECSSLTSITIPSSVTNIEEEAFSGCISLSNIIVPSSVTSIGRFAFEGCSSLTNIIIPRSVTIIESFAFFGCINLTIKCELPSKPSGWDSNWNPHNRPVEWGKKDNPIIEGGNDLNVIVGDVGRLPVYVSNSGNKTLTYKSNNTAVITIDDKGNYTALAVGQTTITVTAHDGTKKDIPVRVTVLATGFEKCEIQGHEGSKIIMIDPTNPDLYYIFARTTDKDEEFGPIVFDTVVTPAEASQNVKITVDNPKIATVSATGKVTIKLPQKGTIDNMDLVVTLQPEKIKAGDEQAIRKITLKLCPIDDELFAFDFTKKIASQEYDSKNADHIYVLRVFNSSFIAPFNGTGHIVVGNGVDFKPEVVVKVTLKDNTNVELASHIDSKNNQLRIDIENKIQPNAVTPIVINVKDNITGLECATEVNVFYALQDY